MASQLVLEALESLHKELDKMQPAIRQVEIAEQVIAEARKIPEQYLKLMTRIEGQETNFKQKLVGELNGHADQVRKEVNTLVSDANDIIANLADHEEKLSGVRANLEPAIKELTSLQLEPRLDKLQDTADTKLGEVASSVEHINTGIKSIQERLNVTEVTIGNRLTEEGRTRRDQLDNQANIIKDELRQFNDRLTDRLKKIGDDLDDQILNQSKKQLNQLSLLQSEIENHTAKVENGFSQLMSQFREAQAQLDVVQQQQEAQKTSTYITWVLIAITVGAILVTKYVV